MSNDTSDVTQPVNPVETQPKPRTQASATGAPWGAWAAVIIVVVVFLLAQLAGAYLLDIYPHLKHFSHGETTNWFNSVSGQFFYVLLIEALSLGFLWLFIRRYRGKGIGVRAALGISRRGRLEDIAYAFVGVVAYFGLYLALLSAVTSVVSINVDQHQDVGFQTVVGNGPLFLTFISLVILPPIVEEIMFRGFLYSGLKKHLGFIGGALLTSLLFAAPHLLESDSGGLLWSAGIDTFTLSLVLCYIREKTGAIYAGMGVHSLKNFIAFVSLYLVHVH